jgi:hypothetical protein
MSINIFFINKIKEFLVLDIFDISIKNILVFYILTNSYRNWMIKKSNRIFSFFCNVSIFLNNLIFSTYSVFEQIKFEKPKIRKNSDFWQFYFISIHIHHYSKTLSTSQKFKLAFIKFVCKKLLRCKDLRIEESFSYK